MSKRHTGLHRSCLCSHGGCICSPPASLLMFARSKEHVLFSPPPCIFYGEELGLATPFVSLKCENHPVREVMPSLTHQLREQRLRDVMCESVPERGLDLGLSNITVATLKARENSCCGQGIVFAKNLHCSLWGHFPPLATAAASVKWGCYQHFRGLWLGLKRGNEMSLIKCFAQARNITCRR